MNARTARKLLRRGQTRNFWGRRSLVRVRVPLCDIPEPYPPFDGSALGAGDVFLGHFLRREGGRVYATTIDQWTGGAPADVSKAFLLKREPSLTNTLPEEPWFSWWEAVVCVYEEAAFDQWTGGTPFPDPVDQYDLDEETVGRYVAQRDWIHRHVVTFEYPVGSPLRALGRAANFAKTTYGAVAHGFLYLTYSVKYFQRDRADRFCSALASAFKRCKRAGLPLRVI